MCGIIGMVGVKNAIPYLMEGLSRLEYRGYDSAGIAFLNGNQLACKKALGKLENLRKTIQNDARNTNIGIGHTRWATHGKPSFDNAHPHISPNAKFAVVHNGIIENADSLKNEHFPNTSFASQTDTEVIVHLLQKYYNGNMVQTVSCVQKLLLGSYALGIISTEYPNTLFCTAKGSPLIAAVGEVGNFIASDVSAVFGYASGYYNLSNGEICAVQENDIKFFNNDAVCIEKQIEPIIADALINDKQSFEHYMMLEMMQQPDAVRNTLEPLFINGEMCLDSFVPDSHFLKNSLSKIVIVACGSAYHAGLVGERLFEDLARVETKAQIASEFRYSNPIINQNTLAIFISQSGETADTLAALRLAKLKNAKVLSIVNVRSSAIANESDYVIYTKAGREVAVATTKAYSSQLAVLYALSLYISKIRQSVEGEMYDGLIKQLLCLPQKISETIINTQSLVKCLAQHFYTQNDMYFIGRQLDFAVSMEGSLKCKEISYIHSESYAAGELKHGTISLIEQGTPVIAVATDETVIGKTVSNMREVEARGAKTVLVTFEKYKDCTDKSEVIVIPETASQFSASLSVIPLQFLSYYMAKLRGCDIDKPKNLAKSVTVE
ncbi:MAG: glutamine--fructose-6-phosphate transaminase (isomerizing) [Ruminococcaceae bacterium]|nr:glutamine--fructose-6-phosphate transaminase (isomerizing) [Oscillospiraceae bacterium]